MSMLHAPEAVLCRCFPVTLKGSAKHWWNALNKRSIDSFWQLSQKFIHHFLADTKQKLPPHVLIQMRQGQDESLRAYFKRFQAKRLEVNDPGSAVAMSVLAAGLQDNELADSLAKKPVANYEQLMSKAHRYMDMEDVRAYKTSARRIGTSDATILTPTATTSTRNYQKPEWHKDPSRTNPHPN
ncbi:uncharacterized protein LOC109835189 [Asparagus officinalis]|uniref:uncharacterized protein LOC109835189 n=1 Tax=Asparagus officinalis TaxID=4686 RepID=UPI00098E3061|nr:uncharacterized protein LOC109835189 [Asparagus officinalis]